MDERMYVAIQAGQIVGFFTDPVEANDWYDAHPEGCDIQVVRPMKVDKNPVRKL